MKPYYRRAYELERESNPDFVEYRAEKSLADYQGNALIIHSSDDKMVQSKFHFRVLKKAREEKTNIRFLEVEGKGHNPNYTADAVRYKDVYLAELKSKAKRGELDTEEAKRAFLKKFDWNRMTAQDESVWRAIFETLDA